jgi:16S rRNA (cytidine1402-2'-O)-methyltransferase
MERVPLVLAATPIGNAEDASPRLRRLLATADVVAAEDTRRLHRLTSTLDVTPSGRVVSYYDAVETARTAALLDELRQGRTVLLVTDAGMPLVSDPGYRLVAAAAAEGLDVTVVPGPSAVLAALAVSGLPSDRWTFEGFLPRKAGERRRRLAELAADRRTCVLFEAPRRLPATLRELAEMFGADRRAAVCRELTKTYEEVRRGTLGDLAAGTTDDVRGEVTVVVAGSPDVADVIPDSELAAQVQRAVDGGMSRRDAIDQVAGEHGISRRAVYRAATSL